LSDQRSQAASITAEVRVPSPEELNLGDHDSKASDEASDFAHDRDLGREKAIGEHTSLENSC